MALAIEAAAVFVVAFGAIQALSGVVVLIFQRAADEMQGREIWLKFATGSCWRWNSRSPPTSCARPLHPLGTTSASLP